MDDTTILGGALNQLGQTVKQTAKQIVKIPEEMMQDAAGQVGVTKSAASAQGSGEPKQWQSDEDRIKFLKDLYGKSDMSQDGASDPKKNVNLSDKSASSAEASAAKPEEQRELMALRNQLHKEVYYDPTFNPPKKQEERPAEKVEKEKQQEMMDLQQKEEEKPKPMAVVMGQNKAEQFRGATG